MFVLIYLDFFFFRFDTREHDMRKILTDISRIIIYYRIFNVRITPFIIEVNFYSLKLLIS